MDEALIRGAIQGAALGAVGFVAYIVWKIIRSQSEVARRIKVVAGIAFVALFIAAFIDSGSSARMEMLVIAVVIAAIVWVFKGSKKDE